LVCPDIWKETEKIRSVESNSVGIIRPLAWSLGSQGIAKFHMGENGKTPHE
jgi:hypothetical protein